MTNKEKKEDLKEVASALAYQRTVGVDKRIEELEKENAELKSELTKKADTNHSLVEQMAKLEEENAKLKGECRICVYTDSPCVLSDYPSKNGICSHYKNVFDENAELKYELKEIKKRILPQDMCELMAEVKENYENKVKAKQLTKAKEIIKRYVDFPVSNDELWELHEEAEQFLKDKNIILEDAQAGNSPFDADEVFNKEMKSYPDEN